MFYFMTALNFKLNLHLQNGILNFDSCVSQSFFKLSSAGGENLHQLDLHWHADGAQHPDGVRLPQDQGVLQGEARAWVPGGRHEVGGARRDDRRAHDYGEEKKEESEERRRGMDEVSTLKFTSQALCMNELRGCQKYSMGPNFIYFGAQK